jgi:hypothetical protein
MSWREQFQEDNQILRALIGGWPGKIYCFFAILTFAKQLGLRWPLCEGMLSCTLSFAKGAAWAAVWPFYWLNYATDFVLFRPFW